MSGIHDVLYPPKEYDTRVSHRRYDGKERLVARSVRQGDHFLVFRVDAFREVMLASGETLDVPEAIQCRFSEQDIDASAAFADECLVSHSTDGNAETNGTYTWAGREVDCETQLQLARARTQDPTVGHWITGNQLGHVPADDNSFPFVKPS